METELLAIIISTGTKKKSAEQIAEEILKKYDSFYGMTNQPLEEFLELKGLSDVKIIRIAATFEIARCIARETRSHDKKTKLPEKSARIPETRESNWKKIIPDYP